MQKIIFETSKFLTKIFLIKIKINACEFIDRVVKQPQPYKDGRSCDQRHFSCISFCCDDDFQYLILDALMGRFCFRENVFNMNLPLVERK